MPKDQYLHNDRAAYIGIGQFLFALGASTLAEAIAMGLTDMGNFSAFSLQDNVETQPLIKSAGNRRWTSRQDVTQVTLGYQLRTQEKDFEKHRIFRLGQTMTPFVQSSLSSASLDELNFSANSAVPGNWYPLTISGARVRKITSITIAGKNEGTDFFLDRENGYIRFAAAESSTFTASVSAAAITADDPGYKLVQEPGTGDLARGIGTIIIRSKDADDPVALEHAFFSCEITPSGGPSFDGTNRGEISLDVMITDLPGLIYERP